MFVHFDDPKPEVQRAVAPALKAAAPLHRPEFLKIADSLPTFQHKAELLALRELVQSGAK